MIWLIVKKSRSYFLACYFNILSLLYLYFIQKLSILQSYNHWIDDRMPDANPLLRFTIISAGAILSCVGLFIFYFSIRRAAWQRDSCLDEKQKSI